MVPAGRTAAVGVRQPPQRLAALDAGSAGPRRRLGITIARKSIVTKTGDGGETGLLYGGRVAKTDPRTEAYGAVDEAISTLGAARALVEDRSRHAIILRVQSELFTVGAELATDAAEYDKLEQHFMIVTTDFTSRIESEIIDLERRVQLPDAFVIPGGTAAAAALDVARAVLRRAERRIVGLQQGGQLRNPEVLRYTNRLSDLLFMLARAEEGTAVKPLTGRRVARTPAATARTRPAPRRRSRA
ncbi:MAG TPA: cob(I)yrinic acid a,c-diamide adenosyltransferase [Candidatus Dormibacteraeota bacterium]|nr:cob(I)yrinic acid a,c-diamide adenosyltransferase [Candidatus Dormibacteraeota bacterium]